MTLNTRESLATGQWTHVAVTFGRGALRVYFDGRLTAEAPKVRGNITPSDLSLRIGADSEGQSRFVGLIDDVRIYRKAMSAEEIGALARAVK